MLPHGETAKTTDDTSDSSTALSSEVSVDSKCSSHTTSLAPNPRKQKSGLLESLTINKLNFAALGLHGRDHEVSILKGCLDDLSCGIVARQLVLISGYSGTGKTALANTLKEPTQKLKGLYVQGKFGVNTSNEPYIGIAAAAAQICDHILSSQEEAVYEKLCLRIKEDLGSELSLLVHFIPVLSKLVGVVERKSDFSNGTSLPSEDAKNQFMFAFQRFVRIVSDAFAPLVIVLDDLQGADGSSLDLIDALVSDQKNPKVLVIGLYRSNKVDQTHIFHRYLDGFRGKGNERTIQLTEISIGNLDISSGHKIVEELLSMETDSRSKLLAEVCYEKTHGNPLFLLHFLSMLNTRKLLCFNLGLTKWIWDIGEIKANTSVTDNILDLLKGEMLDLSSNLLVILKVAACLGSTFQEQALKVVIEHLSGQFLIEAKCVEIVESGLSKLEQDGYINERVQLPSSEPASSRTFVWTHDKIHEAANSLVTNKNEWVAFGYRVGSILYEKLDPNELDLAIFVVVNLLNQSHSSGENCRLADKEKRLKVAALNYQASQKAVSLAAFESAAAYAAFGINLLPENRWEIHYKLALGLYSIGAQSEGYLGNQDTMERYCYEVLCVPNAPLEHKLVVYHTLIDSNRNRGRPGEAAELILKILKQYGCHFPKNSAVITASVIMNVIRLKSSAESQDIEGLCEMKNLMKVELPKLIDKLFICWYMTQDLRLPLATFRILDLTKRYGYSDYSSVALAHAGMILAGVLDDVQVGTALATQALKLMGKCRNSVTHARTLFVVYSFVLPSTTPLLQMQKPLLLAYDVGLRCGDAETSMFAVNMWLLNRFISGNSLEALELDYRLYSKQMKDLGRLQQYHATNYVWQFLLNLMGHNDGNLLELVGNVFSNEDLSFCKQDAFHAPGLSSYQGLLQAYFGDHVRHADDAIRYGHDYLQKAYPGLPSIPQDHCLKGVSCFVAASLTKKRKYVKMAEKLRSKIKRWREMGNPNVKQFESFLDAESDRFHGKKYEAIQNYEAAVLFGARTGYQHTAAYACERLGGFHLEVMDDTDEASYRIKQSISYWEGYGAAAKVTDLKTKYRHLLLHETQRGH